MNKKMLIISTFLTVVGNLFATTALNTDSIIDKITTYPIEKYNQNETLTLRDQLSQKDKEKLREEIFKNMDFSEKNTLKIYNENSYKGLKITENEEYLSLLIQALRKGKFLQTPYSEEFQNKEEDRLHYGDIHDTEININDFHRLESIERFMKRATGVPVELSIELVQQKTGITGNKISLYHLILKQKKVNNRIVAVIPYEVDITNKKVTRIDSDFVFITPMKVYNGIAEFFNTFVTKKNRYEYRFDTGRILEEKDKNYEVTIFNSNTLKIADTRDETKFAKYIDELLNEKMGDIFKDVIQPNKKKENQYITQEEYNDLINKAHRILHNYEYIEVSSLKAENNKDYYENNQKLEKDIQKKNKTSFIDIKKSNECTVLNLVNNESLFKEIPLNDEAVYEKDSNGYLINKLKDEYSDYFRNLLSTMAEERLGNSDVTINSIESFIQKITGKSTQKSIELVDVEGTKYHYHITVSTHDYENRNVLIVPITVDTKDKKIEIDNKNLIFSTPWNVYTGTADFFDTYLEEFAKF